MTRCWNKKVAQFIKIVEQKVITEVFKSDVFWLFFWATLENFFGSFWASLVKIRLLLILASGHTASESENIVFSH